MQKVKIQNLQNVIVVTMSNKNEFGGGGGVRLKMRNREGVALRQACVRTPCADSYSGRTPIR